MPTRLPVRRVLRSGYCPKGSIAYRAPYNASRQRLVENGAGQIRAAAPGEPVYEAGVQLEGLLRTAFLADYVVKTPFRQELRRVLNRARQ